MSFIFFHLLLLLIVLSSLFVVLSINPIQSVLFLILVFLLSSVLFLIIGAEFLAILLLTVYVGAISILFLFVVMMLNLRIVELYWTVNYHIPIGSVIGFLFLLIWFFSIYTDFENLNLFWSTRSNNINYFNLWISSIYYVSNLNLIGEVFYNHCFSLFFLAGMVLFIAMIGVIVLTIDFEYHRIVQKTMIDNTDFELNRKSSNLVILSKKFKQPWYYLSSKNFSWFLENKKWPFSYYDSSFNNYSWDSYTHFGIKPYKDPSFLEHVESLYLKYWLFRYLWPRFFIVDYHDRKRFFRYSRENLSKLPRPLWKLLFYHIYDFYALLIRDFLKYSKMLYLWLRSKK